LVFYGRKPLYKFISDLNEGKKTTNALDKSLVFWIQFHFYALWLGLIAVLYTGKDKILKG
jgi:hypothetical protein